MNERNSTPSRCAGVVATACTQGKRPQHGKPQGVVRDDQPDAREGQAGRPGVAERFGVPRKPGNAGGGKGPQFKTDETSGDENGVMAELLRHRQTKEAATDMFTLQPPCHIPTLPKCEVADCWCQVRSYLNVGHSTAHFGWQLRQSFDIEFRLAETAAPDEEHGMPTEWLPRAKGARS